MFNLFTLSHVFFDVLFSSLGPALRLYNDRLSIISTRLIFLHCLYWLVEHYKQHHKVTVLLHLAENLALWRHPHWAILHKGALAYLAFIVAMAIIMNTNFKITWPSQHRFCFIMLFSLTLTSLLFRSSPWLPPVWTWAQTRCSRFLWTLPCTLQLGLSCTWEILYNVVNQRFSKAIKDLNYTEGQR